jgi:hypothetical protein
LLILGLFISQLEAKFEGSGSVYCTAAPTIQI